MLFGKKKDKCKNCNENVEKNFSFCPYCSFPLTNKKANVKDFGLLGENDEIDEEEIEENFAPQTGFTDKIMDSLINSVMKSTMKAMDKQFKEMNQISKKDLANMENARIEQLPNGIKISIGGTLPQKIKQANQKPKVQKVKEITQEQLEKMQKLPRQEAKTKITRLSDKVIYELNANGIESPEDVLISKLESGYEIKAIGKNKIFVNSIPINLQMRGFSFDDKKLLIEFKTEK